jgi:protein TonB
MGARAVQAPEPEPVKRAETAPAPKPEMTLPDPKLKPRPQPKTAPKEAAAKTQSTGPEPQEGTARAETKVRGQGFGLSGGGGGAGGVQLDISGEFCCPEYIISMKSLIEQNWVQKQGLIGITTMKFTIRSDGTLQDIQLEKSSGFEVLDSEAKRALLRTMRLQPLPRAYPNPTLTVHLGFAYERQ